MSSLNWNTFKAKFDAREQEAFENLAYQLFCREHNIKIGMMGYKNQIGIEKEPIQINGEWVSFQAKFYSAPVQKNKRDIIDSINKAKGKNPELNKIYIYLYPEFSESSKEGKKKPDYQIEIEEAAKEKEIKIEWRMPSHYNYYVYLLLRCHCNWKV
jgi:hypothetical protein